MRPEAEAVVGFVRRVERRTTVRAGSVGAAVGFLGAAVLNLGGVNGTWLGPMLAAAGFVIAALAYRAMRRDAAMMIERRAPESRNLVFTAYELAGKPSSAMTNSLVFNEAARLLQRLDAATLFPANGAVAAAVTSAMVWLAIISRGALPLSDTGPRGAAGASGTPSIQSVEVIVTPPAYAGRGAETLRDPSRVQVLAGTRIAFSVRANASSVSLETLDSRDTLSMRDGRFGAIITATADGYAAIAPAIGSRAGARRLIGITVVPDAAPRVKVTAPGHDLLLPDGRRTIALSIDADDDIALATLKLRYTKVSGSGERFTFVEGELPLSIVRNDTRTWKASASWRLDSLALEPGDMVVYRAVATDGRPGAPSAESDAYIAEIAAPGGEAAPGFAVDPEQDRYAVSQQMVILKTERLIAKRASLSAEDYANEAQQIAAEQRKVRAEFVFMLGGELADAPDIAASMTELNEESEAEGEADLLAGRAANAGHVALLRAIRAMSRAAAALTTGDATTALPHERTALTNLESAFSRARIILRALTTRERLDLSRRMTGSLNDAVTDVRPRAQPALDSRSTALRRVLADVAGLGSTSDGDASARASELAARVLRIDPSATALHAIADQLNAAATALASRRTDDARRSLDRATTALATELRSGLPSSPGSSPNVDDARMSGALADALRRANPGGRP
jgi:hypothetical protein